jgi:mannose-6-phosphate isomerase
MKVQQFSIKPYTLYNTIQNYEWGTKNESAFIPHFIGAEVEPDKPYAELWIGAHPKAPSKIEIGGSRIPLNKVIEEYPVECLGEYVRGKFSGTFPFLLKVLSVANALSIQSHPNKLQAQLLHAKDPKNYPDDNHKPEIAIALNSLVALAGFKPVDSIRKDLRLLPELTELVGKDLIDEIIKSEDLIATENLIKQLYGIMMRHADEKKRLDACISKIQKRLTEKESRSPEEEQFLNQHALFGSDVGLLSFFFFNLLHVHEGQAIFTNAGVPHAYIKGNIIECMANSDNVVRAGLTKKFKDVETLLNIIRYDFAESPILQAGKGTDEVTYRTAAEEFEVSRIRKPRGLRKKCFSNARPVVYLITHGSLEVHWNCDETAITLKFSKGNSFFVPAALSQYEIASGEDVEFFAVAIP